jgi:hypothetical protein
MNEQDKIRLADLETAQARVGQDKAEFQRDVVATVAVHEAAKRADAQDAAAEANIRATVAESRERTMATSAGLARQDARFERAAASNSASTATMIGVIAVALVLAVVGYFAWWQPNHSANASTNTFVRTEKVTEKPGAPSTVIVNPPDVNVKVNVPSANPPAEPAAKTDNATPSDPDRASTNSGGDAEKSPTSDSDKPSGANAKPADGTTAPDGR